MIMKLRKEGKKNKTYQSQSFFVYTDSIKD